MRRSEPAPTRDLAAAEEAARSELQLSIAGYKGASDFTESIPWLHDLVARTDAYRDAIVANAAAEATARIEALEAALRWALAEGGWRLVYYAARDEIPAILDVSDMHRPRILP